MKLKQKTKWVTFSYSPKVPTELVVLKGEWDQWKPITLKQKKNGDFFVRKKLPAGDWQYGYEVDTQWKTPEDTQTISSPYGTKNAIVSIKEEL